MPDPTPEKVTLARTINGIRYADDPTDTGCGPWSVLRDEREADAMREWPDHEVVPALILPEGKVAVVLDREDAEAVMRECQGGTALPYKLPVENLRRAATAIRAALNDQEDDRGGGGDDG